MAALCKDPRTGIFVLRKRIPTHYRAVSGSRGDTVKISTGMTDRKTAEKLLSGMLERRAAMKAEWDTADELDLLIAAAGKDWADVEPAIFGVLQENALDDKSGLPLVPTLHPVRSLSV
jgi:hypothetical protein